MDSIAPSAFEDRVVVELSSVDANELRTLLRRHTETVTELRHARETFHRRGDDDAERRVEDLECEVTCAAQKIAQLVARTVAPALLDARERVS